MIDYGARDRDNEARDAQSEAVEARARLGPLLGEPAYELASTTGIALDIIICNLVNSCAVAAQNLYDVQRPGCPPMGLNSLSLVVAPSGAGNRSIARACQKVFLDAERRYREESQLLDVDHRTAQEVWNEKRHALRIAIRKGTAQDKDTAKFEQQLRDLNNASPTKLLTPRWLYENCPIEALHHSLGQQWNSALIFNDEEDFVTGHLGRHQLKQFNKLWDSRPVQIDRRGSPPLLLDDVRVSLALAMQEAPARDLVLGKKGLEIGFVAQALFCYTRSLRVEPWGRPNGAISALQSILRSLLEEEINRILNAQPRQVLTLSSGADERVAKFERTAIEATGFQGFLQGLDAVAARVGENVAKIAGSLHVAERRSGDISVETVETACWVHGRTLRQFAFFFGTFNTRT